jgi:hypothetical protein
VFLATIAQIFQMCNGIHNEIKTSGCLSRTKKAVVPDEDDSLPLNEHVCI